MDFREIAMGAPSPNGLTLEMPPAERLHDLLQDLGISDSSRVIVYYGKDWVSPATRVIFMLDETTTTKAK